MAVTRIKNNQITDATIVASSKLTDYSISAGKIANNLTYGSNLTISGNLTVNGNTTAIDTNITTIEDPVILLASTATGAPTVDIGFLGQRGYKHKRRICMGRRPRPICNSVYRYSRNRNNRQHHCLCQYQSIERSEATGDLNVTGASNIANMNVACCFNC